MRVFKHQWTTLDKATGRRVRKETKKWYIEWTGPDGSFHREPGYVDRRSTEQLLAKRVREAEQIHAGLLTPSMDMARQPLADHLAEYLAGLAAEETSTEHLAIVGQRCRKILAGLRWSRWADIDPHALKVWLSGLRHLADGSRGLAIRTTNHYLRQFRAFATWLARRLKAVDPLVELQLLNADTDRRRQRRALSEPDFGQLVAAALASPKKVRRLSGRERALLYVVAACTGLRSAELGSLTPEQVQLESEPPVIVVEAGYSKHRRRDEVPLSAAVVAQLRDWLATRPAGLPIWPGSWASDRRAASVLRVDLEAAGIPYVDSRGLTFDFHSLRGQFATSLARAGVPLTDAQQLMRHSTPALTANIYTHLAKGELARQLDRLPAPPKTDAAG